MKVYLKAKSEVWLELSIVGTFHVRQQCLLALNAFLLAQRGVIEILAIFIGGISGY